MSADQRAPFQPSPLSQRDGSALANSNCRPTSIAVGLAYDTASSSHPTGSKTSTGSKMRSYMSDQSGGTSSADAVEGWQRGYSEQLTVRDGRTFDDALADLRAGRLVHLDVWAAACGGPVCLSGSGGYGHTCAVLPDCSGGSWLVCDPWCSPAKWARVPESRLRAGAEEWGRRVYGAATLEADYPATGAWPSLDELDDRRWAILRRVVAAHMTAYHAGGPDDPSPSPPETAGPQRILFTATAAHTPSGGSDVRFITATGYDDTSSQTIRVAGGTDWFYFDGTRGGSFSKDSTVHVFGLTDVTGEFAVLINTGAPFSDGVTRPTLVKVKVKPPLTEVAICPPAPEPPPSTDCDAALAARDIEWESWVLDGSPSHPSE